MLNNCIRLFWKLYEDRLKEKEFYLMKGMPEDGDDRGE